MAIHYTLIGGYGLARQLHISICPVSNISCSLADTDLMRILQKVIPEDNTEHKIPKSLTREAITSSKSIYGTTFLIWYEA
ncbi:MAG: hypothetical protein K9N46_10660 [Candidatus Marinimicrobia bacterium]|nr:hypothetical protein [Candidatus Neomarinimicrobiota bacterium]MCF7829159.1 hypothetical protein [Candidatus Neomarinimicrobiota bacterium]MCF7881188.1 hypothetical protein [Candidatus Neomarinimicrobiota bacterium]